MQCKIKKIIQRKVCVLKISKVVFLNLIIFLCLNADPPTLPPESDYEWILVLEDNFNGPVGSKPNEQIWHIRNGTKPRIDGWHVEEAVYLDGEYNEIYPKIEKMTLFRLNPKLKHIALKKGIRRKGKKLNYLKKVRLVFWKQKRSMKSIVMVKNKFYHSPFRLQF